MYLCQRMFVWTCIWTSLVRANVRTCVPKISELRYCWTFLLEARVPRLACVLPIIVMSLITLHRAQFSNRALIKAAPPLQTLVGTVWWHTVLIFNKLLNLIDWRPVRPYRIWLVGWMHAWSASHYTWMAGLSPKSKMKSPEYLTHTLSHTHTLTHRYRRTDVCLILKSFSRVSFFFPQAQCTRYFWDIVWIVFAKTLCTRNAQDIPSIRKDSMRVHLGGGRHVCIHDCTIECVRMCE